MVYECLSIAKCLPRKSRRKQRKLKECFHNIRSNIGAGRGLNIYIHFRVPVTIVMTDSIAFRSCPQSLILQTSQSIFLFVSSNF